MYSGLHNLPVVVPMMELKTTNISVDISVMPSEIKRRKRGKMSFNPSRAIWHAVWQMLEL